MAAKDIDKKKLIEEALKAFGQGDFSKRARGLFQTLGYNAERTSSLPLKTFEGFATAFETADRKLNPQAALADQWKSVDLLFQLTVAEVLNQVSLFDTKQVDNTAIESYIFFGIDLEGASYTRTDLSKITREVNKLFPMPAMILFKTGELLTLSVINRRISKKDSNRDVLEKVTLIKDIRIANPHRAHIEILHDLSFEELYRKHDFANFVELHQAWQKTLDTKELNKKFFQELADWYFWATDTVKFPADLKLHEDKKKDEELRNATAVIRLITRLIFVWFLKEKDLVPDDLFDLKKLKQILRFTDPKKSSYYKAILQNLFFATLNTEMKTRKFRSRREEGRDGHFYIHNVFRYEQEFIKPSETLEKLFAPVPFLNGGLFECLDREEEVKGKLRQIRIDGFSDREDNMLAVPDILFFNEKGTVVDLSPDYGTPKKKSVTVHGLIDILGSYKFTITENTPLEEEVALDPELLGKVFENLLASYNPETKTTARKQTGSFYTPREIVNYMVDESLISYLKNKMLETTPGVTELGSNQVALFGNDVRKGQLKMEHKVNANRWEGKEAELEAALRDLLSYSENETSFDTHEKDILIRAIDNCKILDPACGSGAFPMGILHKLVHILHKLDPQNREWKKRQVEKVEKLIAEAEQITDTRTREKVIADLEETRVDVEQAFDNNELDYGRKLYLIENCIYGVDIQPIAVQIAKLRFFISLVVDQRVSPEKANLGIRPMPNLETKFVAANTLIALEKEKANLFTNPEIDRKKAQLKKVRHDYFEARTPKRKEKCRAEDKRLREELSVLLVQDHNLQPETAKKIAVWDPYDQNCSAGFFDMEWMYGIREGFDVVIGNPPYITYKGKEIIEISDEEVKQLIALYPNSAEYKVNSYALFSERGVNLLKTNGTLSYIIPSTILQNEYLKKIRKYLITKYHISQIVSFANKVFDAVTDSVIIFANNRYSQTLETIAVRKSDLDFSLIIDRKIYSQSKWNDSKNDYVINLKTNQKEDEILNKTEENCKFLEDYLEVYVGIVANGIKKFLAGSKIDSNHKKYLQGKHIENFEIKPQKLYINFIKEKLHSNTDESVYLKKEKILVRKTGNRLIAVIDTEKYYTDQSIYNLYEKRGRSINLKIITGILNSNLLEYYFNKKMITNPDVFPYIKGIHLKKLPVKAPEKGDNERNFCNYVSYLHFIRKHTVEFQFFFRIINAIVYEIYLPEYIRAANCEVQKHIDKLPELKDDWSEEKKLKVIEKVYEELSDPKHPVSIAMARMQEVEEVRIIEGKV